MNKPELIDETFARLFGADDFRELSYDELSGLVGRWIEFVESKISDISRDDDAGFNDLERLSRYLAKRPFAEFRNRVKTRTQFESALLELFVQSRIRTYVLAYLSVQEGEDFEGSVLYDNQFPLLISQSLGNLGRYSNCSLNLPIWKIKVQIHIDPFVHLRRIYFNLLFSRRGRKLSILARAQIACHSFMFRSKIKLVTAVIKSAIWRSIGRNPEEGFSTLLRYPSIRRLIAIVILVLFPSADQLNEPEWLDLLSRIEEYFSLRAVGLMAVIPERSRLDHGVIKLIKLALGTIAGRTSVREVHEMDNVEFIFNTLRLAYSWGVTYPLVDNVLDSSLTESNVRAQIISVLSDLFSDRKHTFKDRPHEIDDPCVRELFERLTEVLSLVPADRLAETRKILGNLLESHQRDSIKRLSMIDTKNMEELRYRIMIDTALKAALVRIATMEISGINVCNHAVSRCIVRSLFNQLGDDLWDIYDDADDDRVTPFTLFLMKGGNSNPFDFYFRYTILLSDGFARRRRIAAFMGFCETLRDSLLSLYDRTGDSLNVKSEISSLLNRLKLDWTLGFINDVPHVDFDAVLFKFEKACYDILPDRNRFAVLLSRELESLAETRSPSILRPK